MFEDKATVSSTGMDVAAFGGADWQQADRALRSIAARRAGLDAEEMRWLLVARRTALHRQLGFATLAEYLERVLGYRPHTAAERLRVAESLDHRARRRRDRRAPATRVYRGPVAQRRH